jgi:hypothetical protein
MENPDIEVLLRAKVVEVGRGFVVIEQKRELHTFDDYDTLVVATHKVSNNLHESKVVEKVSEKVVYIGDAKEPRGIKEAIHEGSSISKE